LPSAAASIGGALAWRAHRFVRAEIDGLYAWPQTIAITQDAGGTLTAVVVGARACVPFGGGVFEIAACAGIDVTRMHGQGQVAIARSADSWWWGPEAGLTARVRASAAIGLRASVIGSAPLARRRFVIDGVGTVGEPDFVGVRMAIGPEVLF
jgi:hypothetical protein